MKIIHLLLISAFLFGCYAPEEEENKSSTTGIGDSIRDIVVAYSAHDSSGNILGSVTIRPHDAGFSMTMTPRNSFFYCSLGDDYLIQNGQQFEIKWSSKSDYDKYPTLYNGWVESGGADGCTTLYTEQLIYFTSAKVGYSPSTDYDIALTDLYYNGGKLRIPVRF